MDDDLIDRKNKLLRMLPVLTGCWLWLFSANLEQAKITWAEGTSTEKISLTDKTVGKSVRHFLD